MKIHEKTTPLLCGDYSHLFPPFHHPKHCPVICSTSTLDVEEVKGQMISLQHRGHHHHNGEA
ncbi:hypothetical protein DERF_011567 [Dermatophagoides farinae]|uniref:Uncharacterized protein n=1 Tax=Dermatophagoides farinae TaxID=6954 RepID=A0A922HSF8_DERFA|nr:hypothetical protein DERF_011567 [Dermatophagoides farinae]